MRRFLALMFCGSVGFIGGGMYGFYGASPLFHELADTPTYFDYTTPFVSADTFILAVHGIIEEIDVPNHSVIVHAVDPHAPDEARRLRIAIDDNTRIFQNRMSSGTESDMAISIDSVTGSFEGLTAGSVVTVWMFNGRNISDLRAIALWEQRA